MDTDRIVSVETWNEANRVPRARLVLYEGPKDDAAFPLSGEKTFLPGAKIVIGAGYGEEADTLHSGVIVRHSLRLLPGVSPQLVIETADPLLAMSLRRNSAVSLEKTDRDLIAALVSASGGTVGKNEASAEPHESFVQYNACDWDLMLLRAEAGGCVVVVEDSKVDVIAPGAATSPVLELDYEQALVSLEATLDAAAPVAAGAVKSRSWSYGEQSVIVGAAQDPTVTAPGNFGAAELAKVFALDTVAQQSGALLAEARLKGWSSAALLRAKLAAVQGTAQFQGSRLAKPGSVLTLKGVGPRFEGNAFVGSVRHVIRAGDWQTVVGLGMAPESFGSRASEVAAPAAGGLLPPIRGLHTGQVKQVATDPTGDFRVLVTLPLVGGENGVWARPSQIYASNTFGALFYPEVGDEVVLGFMDDSPGDPIILGSLYSRTLPPKYAPNEKNDTKAIVSRSNLEVVFNDKEDEVVLEIKTKDGRRIRLADKKDKEVRVEDQYGNSIVMTEAKVDIHSVGEMNISSGKDMTIKSGGKLTVTATAPYSVSAPEIKETASGQLKIHSDGLGELSCAAVLTVKGALVQIN
ncbi:MAG TPA: phage baseplate assembly protein V [Allosphingosinicella sp.]|nr:phage baseplate assembly protein V [Allosphingosinicella sp.]